MMTEGSNILHYAAMILILAFLAARVANKRDGSFKSLLAARIKRIVGRQHVELPTLKLKKCPECDEQVPLSALICEACDYNFLSRAVAHRHKLLPAPSEPLVHEASSPSFAYRT